MSRPDDAGRPDTPPLPADLRPFDDTPVHTADLPPTPIRDRNVPAEAWVEAPEALLRSADDLAPPDGEPPRIAYKRRLGDWLLWRAGPAKGAGPPPGTQGAPPVSGSGLARPRAPGPGWTPLAMSHEP